MDFIIKELNKLESDQKDELILLLKDYLYHYPDEEENINEYLTALFTTNYQELYEYLKNRNGRKLIFHNDDDILDYCGIKYEE